MPTSERRASQFRDYAKRLTEHLEVARSKGHNQKSVAALAGISAGWLSTIKKRKESPSEATNEKIIAALTEIGINASDLRELLGTARTKSTTSWDHGFRLITDNAELRDEMLAIAEEAEDIISCTGSRSREVRYLDAILTNLSNRPNLRHRRALYGEPWNDSLKEHLLKLIDLRNRSKHNKGRIMVSLVMNKEYLVSEQFVSANEKRALVILPSFSEAGNFDSGMVFTQPEHVASLIKYGEDLANLGVELKTRSAIQALPVLGAPEADR